MTSAFDFSKLRRLIVIYAVVQILLVALLVYVALHFQAGFQADAYPHRFLKSVLAALLIQVALFYPVSKFAAMQAQREVDGCVVGLDPEALKVLRKKRMVGDAVKMAVFIFFVTFILRAPQNKLILSILFFSFILTILSYFQCFNFVVRRKMREKN